MFYLNKYLILVFSLIFIHGCSGVTKEEARQYKRDSYKRFKINQSDTIKLETLEDKKESMMDMYMKPSTTPREREKLQLLMNRLELQQYKISAKYTKKSVLSSYIQHNRKNLQKRTNQRERIEAERERRKQEAIRKAKIAAMKRRKNQKSSSPTWADKLENGLSNVAEFISENKVASAVIAYGVVRSGAFDSDKSSSRPASGGITIGIDGTRWLASSSNNFSISIKGDQSSGYYTENKTYKKHFLKNKTLSFSGLLPGMYSINASGTTPSKKYFNVKTSKRIVSGKSLYCTISLKRNALECR